MMNENEILSILDQCKIGETELFVEYVSGGKVTEKAIREARVATTNGVSRRFLFGKLESVGRNKKGQLVFTLLSKTRTTEGHPELEGGYRTVNPSLGNLLKLEIVEP